MKKFSTLFLFSLLLLMFASASVFAASETKIETEQGGYLILSNIVEEIDLIQDDPVGSDKAYISDGAVTLTMFGDGPSPTIYYYSEADIIDDYFMPSGDSKLVEVTGSSIVLTEPGYYSGYVYFGLDFSFASTATFVVQVRDSQTSPTSDINGEEVSNFTFDEGYSMEFPEAEILKLQRIQGVDDEFGRLDVEALVIKTPDLEGYLQLGELAYAFKALNADASRAYISFESHFGGQIGVADTVELIDGKYESSIKVSQDTIKNEIIFVNVYMYDENGELLQNITGMNFIFDDFDRAGYTRSDLDTHETELDSSIVTAIPTSSKVLVNGKEVSFQAYLINGNNYFKLRDLAMVLSGTEKSFEVGWDGIHNAISLESGKEYTAVGGELVVSEEKPVAEKGTLSTSTIYLNGEKVELTAYLINGNNYFKLRDVANAIDFGVTWDGETNTIGIDSSTDYVPE